MKNTKVLTIVKITLLILLVTVIETESSDLSDIFFITIGGHFCEGVCPSNYCTTQDGTWDYCSSFESRTIRAATKTNNIYSPCTDICRREDGNWCHVIGSRWEYCDPEVVDFFTEDMAETGMLCLTPCRRYGSSYKCYDKLKSWVSCYPFPDKRFKISKITKEYNIYGEYTENGYQLCTECSRNNSTQRSKRHQPSSPNGDSDLGRNITKRHINFFRTNVDVGHVAARYEAEFPEHIVRHIDPNDIVSTETNPIISYTMYPVAGVFGLTQTFLPLSLRSLLTYYTQSTERRHNNNLPTAVEANYQNMGPILGVDERFHGVAARFNGPAQIYNVFPGTWQQNRGRLSRWNYMESDMARFINRFRSGYIEQTLVLSYDFNDPHNPMRPNAIGMRLRFYDNQHRLTDARGVPLNNRPNPFENMYYNNDPNYCCMMEGDQSPDR